MRHPKSENGDPGRDGAALLGPRLGGLLERARKVFEECPDDSLARVTRLRELLPEAEARAAVELFVARERAAGKLPEPERWWLTRRGLEQSSHERVARWRARRVAQRLPEGARFHDATCGMGMDALAMLEAGAALGLRMVASDLSPITAGLAARNLAAFGWPGRVVCADATRAAVDGDFALFDPDRRTGQGGEERRVVDPRAGSPPLARLIQRCGELRGAVWKLAPGLHLEGSQELVELAGRTPLEWVSVGHGRELAETCVLTGELAEVAGRRSAVVLREGLQANFSSTDPDPELTALDAQELDDLAWIAIPHPALTGARLLGTAGEAIGARPLGPGLGWFGSCGDGDGPPPAGEQGPFWRHYRVLDSAPADRKRIRALLARHAIGPLQVLTRGHSEAASSLERRFSSAKGKKGTLLVARTTWGRRAYLAEQAKR